MSVPHPSQQHLAFTLLAKEEMGELFCLFFYCCNVLKWEFWLWMYWRKVRDLHLPCFMIVVSDAPFIFIAIAPPARSECTPTKFGAIPCFFSLRLLIDFLIHDIMSDGVMQIQLSFDSSQTLHRRLVVVPSWLSMWFTLLASAFTEQNTKCILFWWIVSPICPFF